VQPALATEVQSAIALLEKTPGVLETLLHAAPSDILEWKPASERWSIHEVVAHLLDIEKLFLERVRRILQEDAPELPKYEPGSSLGGPGRDALDQLALLGRTRSELVALAKDAPASAAMRMGMHQELGTITLGQVLNELANHDLGHLRQIAELYRARVFYPNCGPFQRYSNPQP
jgi:uncharacterized damage-inducible protein DinB